MPLTKTHQKILSYLKWKGPQPAARLATNFNMTTEGVRLHLIKLEEAGFVRSETISQGRGRPQTWYYLTPESDCIFPSQYARLANQLIELTPIVFGPEGLKTLIQSKKEADYQRYAVALEGITTPSERLKKLASLRKEEGYLAELVSEGNNWLLIEHHCPIRETAALCSAFCESELEIITRLAWPLWSVQREALASRGDRQCVYRFTPAQ
jgi:predicted ArsR family transcriptional regulator